MSGHKPFNQLRDKLRSTPKGRTAAEREVRRLHDMRALTQLREARGMTQADIAKAWETSQANISRVEHEDDVYLSTLRRYVAALGGRLELTAVFPDQSIRLDTQRTEHVDQHSA